MKLMNAALVAALLATGGIASAQSMGQGFDMLTTALEADFRRLGISMESTDDLTISQLAEIKQVIESDDNESQKKGRIEAIIRNN